MAKRASLFVDHFMKLLVRYVIDVLHYRAPSRTGLSPARKFEAIANRIQCKEPPTEDEIRVAFGTLLERKLTRAGIRFPPGNWRSPRARRPRPVS